MPALFHRALLGLVELVAPSRCAACDGLLDAGAPPPSSGRGATAPGFCGACAPLLERAPASLGPGVAYTYGGPLADAIRRYKYGGRSELAAPLGALLAEAALEFAGRIDLVVPVPLHGARLRDRGYDQAALLSAPVARRLGVRRAVDALERVRPTAVQASLERARRTANVRSAFAARPLVAGARVLVLDDVRTTGATLGEACAALGRAGARAVHPLALAGTPAGEADDPA